MTLCEKCIPFGKCTSPTQIEKQANYLDMPKFQNEEWYEAFEDTLNRAENYGCLNEELPNIIAAARVRLAQARLQHP